MKKRLLCSFLLLSGFYVTAQSIQLSPQVFSSQGNNFVGTGFELSYTIGELAAISTISSGNITLTQGFHQPDKFTIITIKPLDQLFGAEIYPNPSSDMAQIKISSDEFYDLSIELYDASGRKLRSEKVNHYPGEQLYTLNTSELSAGTYLVRFLTENGRVSKTLRLNKIYQ
jgi:hypothetical protein